MIFAFFLLFAIDSAEKRPEFLAKTFFLVFSIDSSEKNLNFYRRPISV